MRAASFTSSPCVSEGTLLLVRAAIFSWCFFILAQSAFHEGPGCLRFFTVWNFIVLTVFFGIGTGLSCTCCRHSAERGPITRDHRIWAGLHRLLFEIELPMTMLVAVIVWFAIYPNAVSVAQQTGDYSGQLAVLSLCSLTPTPALSLALGLALSLALSLALALTLAFTPALALTRCSRSPRSRCTRSTWSS